jgi:Zn finger protein HypA/HybF involved in hydrogenase expression
MVTEQTMNHKTYRHYAKLAIKSKLKNMEITRTVKKCARCYQDKSYTEFNIDNKNNGDGFQGYCKDCQSAYYKAYNASRTEANAKSHPQSKTCLDCHLDKPISQYGKRAISLDKHNSYCKPCWRQRTRIATRKMKNGG